MEPFHMASELLRAGQRRRACGFLKDLKDPWQFSDVFFCCFFHVVSWCQVHLFLKILGVFRQKPLAKLTAYEYLFVKSCLGPTALHNSKFSKLIMQAANKWASKRKSKSTTYLSMTQKKQRKTFAFFHKTASLRTRLCSPSLSSSRSLKVLSRPQKASQSPWYIQMIHKDRRALLELLFWGYHRENADFLISRFKRRQWAEPSKQAFKLTSSCRRVAQKPLWAAAVIKDRKTSPRSHQTWSPRYTCQLAYVVGL